MIALMLLSAPALAQPPAAPSSNREPAPGEERLPPRRWWQPIPYFYRQIDLERQNVGANGRKNATRQENIEAMTPSLQQLPFGDDW